MKNPNTQSSLCHLLTLEGLSLLQVFDCIDEPIYLCDPDTYEILYANQALRSLFDDVLILGKKCYKLLQSLDSPCPFCTNKFIFGKNVGKTHIWEFHNKAIDRWYHCIDRAVPWSNGKMVRYEMAIDITEQKKNEQKNKQITEDLSLLNLLNEAVNRGDSLYGIIDLISQETIKTFASNGVTIYLLDEDKKHLVMQNIPHSYKSIGKIEHLIGMRIPEVRIPLKDNSEYYKILKGEKSVLISDKKSIINLMKEHTENEFFKSLAPKVNKILEINHTILAPVVSKGTPFGLLVVSKKEPFSESDVKRLEFLSTHFQTILKRKIVDDALRESEEHYRILAESANDTIFFVNNKNEVQYINSIGAKLFNKSIEEIIGKKLFELFSDEILEKYRRSIQEVFSTGKPLNAQTFSLFDDKKVWLDTNLVPIKGKNDKIIAVMGISRDITERKKVEKEKEEMREKFFEAEKMKAIAVLTGGIAHDINNMLTAIYSFAGVAIDSVDKKLPVYEYLNQICQVVRRANKLTHKLLGFSHKHLSEFKKVNVNEIIGDLKKLLNSFIGDDVTMSFDLNPNVSSVNADAHKIEQIIMNLVMNAKDAIPKGGEVTVKTENVTIDDKKIKGIPAGKSGKFVCLSVRDTGMGIEEKILDKIFEPFFTTKPDSKGTGLGLSVVNDIISQHNGFITVDSKTGSGTQLKIYFPSVSK